MTIGEQINATLAKADQQAVASVSVSELIDGSAIVRLENPADLPDLQAALERAGLIVDRRDDGSLHVSSHTGTGVEPLGEPLPEGDSNRTDDAKL